MALTQEVAAALIKGQSDALNLLADTSRVLTSGADGETSQWNSKLSTIHILAQASCSRPIWVATSGKLLTSGGASACRPKSLPPSRTAPLSRRLRSPSRKCVFRSIPTSSAPSNARGTAAGHRAGAGCRDADHWAGGRARGLTALDRSRERGGDVLAVIGDYGFGKSHFIELAARRALRENFLVAGASLDLVENAAGQGPQDLRGAGDGLALSRHKPARAGAAG